MQKIVLVLGGARSGKSDYVLKAASFLNGKKAFLATAESLDNEMQVRIEKHKTERGKHWDTFEEPLHIASLLMKIKGDYDMILVDCLTLWLSNIVHANLDVEKEIEGLLSVLLSPSPSAIYLVSNEVGLGIVPETPLGREYRDHLGRLNRAVAETATDVVFMVAGIPIKIKSER
ncbi:MAG: bifunctional adenosylcobinamide kinase/adenosylcobinamide-phosphate guanylyltransferase [Proteobacteria bacterium]|nr:bifunctional adenosylcobinamide kinase/adenosylcobinamide-phosphate guanylyltransferase [Pseudomonadota bacterium]